MMVPSQIAETHAAIGRMEGARQTLERAKAVCEAGQASAFADTMKYQLGEPITIRQAEESRLAIPVLRATALAPDQPIQIASLPAYYEVQPASGQ
jgi:hypothetical protein